ncbi:MAG TPA: hypothetical protein VJL09_03915 [Candidatus Paceibacterota bacterium]
MELLIDTTQQGVLRLALTERDRPLGQMSKKNILLSERILIELDLFLRKHKTRPQNLKKILVNPGPGGFSSTRTGVAVANALAFALSVPVAEWPASNRRRGEPSGKAKKIVLPKYDKEPHITKPKRPR